MKSPFPGMDPFLELHWGDVHTRLIVYASNQINPQLPPDLQARVEESGKVTIDDDGKVSSRTIYPDVSVVEDPCGISSKGSQQTAVAEIAEPLRIRVDENPIRRHIEIIDGSVGGRVVTAIEILSPSNKIGFDGANAYKRKQHEYIAAGVNLVEIDLIRQGEFVVAAPLELVPEKYRNAYVICIRRAEKPWEIELYRASMAETLPNFPIPLRPTDRDAVVRLQPLIDDCYRDGRYAHIDYGQRLQPPLSDAEVAWVAGLVHQRTENVAT